MRVTIGTMTPNRRQFGALLLAFCLSPLIFSLAGCGSDRRAVVKADASSGYCPVCGMKVSDADEWTASIYYNDGTKLMFESPGDSMVFYTAPGKYKATPLQQDRANITKITFKDYQTRQPIDGKQASLVYNSNAEGPMGPDFFPFGNRADAEAFVAKNGGKIISLNDITPEMAQGLRSGH